jgi:drug/metabolite transporter (DMT)-like permease
VAELLAFLAAACFALGTTLQQRGTLETAAGEGDARFLLEILHRPAWLLGAIFQAVGWILQAAALNQGQLEVVQAIVTLSLVIALPLGVWLTGQQVGRWQVAGAFLTLTGIVLFLGAASPQAGTTHPAATAWWVTGIACAATAAGLGALGWTRPGASGAILLAAGAGVGFAFQAAVTKEFVGQLGGGLGAILTSWTPYVLLATAVTSFALQQSALKKGALAVAMASSNCTTLIASVMIGSAVFGETISGGGRLPLAVLSLVLAVGGIVALASPAGLSADYGSAKGYSPSSPG